MSESEFKFTPQKSRLKTALVLSFWLIVLGVIALAFVRSHQASEARLQQQNTILWDEQLLACNNIANAEPTEDFDTCVEMAKAGWIDAAQRVAWAYSRDGEFQSWQSAYEWLVWLREYDEYAKLLSYIVLFEIGESEDLKLDGERGIRQMAVQNQPAASTYLASIYYLGLNTLERRSNIAWLLERAYEKSQYWLMPNDIAEIYTHGYLGDANPDKAKDLLLSVANNDFPFNANNVAWLFATTDDPDLADYSQALALSEKVVAQDAFANNYVYVDTLAAAYAANGQFEQAIETQRTALDLLTRANENADSPHPELENFKNRLSLFEKQQAYVEPIEHTDGPGFFNNLKDEIEQALIENLYVELTPPAPIN
jgi:hypothetical protein